jgi:DNA-binding HxlR family transcriptional regulator
VLDADYPDQVCSVARALEVVGERWTLLIVRDLMLFGALRFDQLSDSVGTTPAMLTRRLRGLIAEGVVARRPYQERPLRHEYHLTSKGEDLFDVLAALMHWGDRHYGPAPKLLVHTDCGQPLQPYLACAHCDQPAARPDIDPRPGPGAVAHISTGSALAPPTGRP